MPVATWVLGTGHGSGLRAPDGAAGRPAAPSPGGEVGSAEGELELVILSPGLSGDPGWPGAPGRWPFPRCGVKRNSGVSLAEGALWPEPPQQICPFPGGDTAPRSPVGGFDENAGPVKQGGSAEQLGTRTFSCGRGSLGMGFTPGSRGMCRLQWQRHRLRQRACAHVQGDQM